MPTFKHTNLDIPTVSKRANGELDCSGTVSVITIFGSGLVTRDDYMFYVMERTNSAHISLWENSRSGSPSHWTDGVKYHRNGEPSNPWHPEFLTFLRDLRDEILAGCDPLPEGYSS